MPNYNLNILQPAEFEDLVRDLLQKQLGVFVESFTIGRDSGIDLRFANVNGDDAIVQAKRYKDYKSLLSNLKKETIKVRNINPKSYYVATSVGLTPQNKRPSNNKKLGGFFFYEQNSGLLTYLKIFPCGF